MSSTHPEPSGDGASPTECVVLFADPSPEGTALAEHLRQQGFTVVTTSVSNLTTRAQRLSPHACVLALDTKSPLDPHELPDGMRIALLTHADSVFVSSDDWVRRAVEARRFERPIEPDALAKFLRDGGFPDPNSNDEHRASATASSAAESLDPDSLALTDFPSISGPPEVASLVPDADGTQLKAARDVALSPEIEHLLATSAERVRTARTAKFEQPPTDQPAIPLPADMLAAVDELLASTDDSAQSNAPARSPSYHRTELGTNHRSEPAAPQHFDQPSQRSETQRRDAHPTATPTPSSVPLAEGTNPEGTSPEGTSPGVTNPGVVSSGRGSAEPETHHRRSDGAHAAPIHPHDAAAAPLSDVRAVIAHPHASPRTPSERPPARVGERAPASWQQDDLPVGVDSDRAAPLSGFDTAPPGTIRWAEPPSWLAGPNRTTEPAQSSTRAALSADPSRDAPGHQQTALPSPSVGAAPVTSDFVHAATVSESAFPDVATHFGSGSRLATPPMAPDALPAADVAVSPVASAPPTAEPSASVDPILLLAQAIAHRTTGALTISSQDGVRRRCIVLRDGDIVTAASDRGEEALAFFLVERGELSPEIAQARAAKLPRSGRHAAAAMIAIGFLSQDDLWPVLRAHGEWIVALALRDAPARAQFEHELPPRLRAEPNAFGGAAGVEVFVESVRRVLSPAAAIAKLGGPDAQLAIGPNDALLAETALASDEIALARSAIGTTVARVLALASPDFAATLYALLALGIVAATGPAHPIAEHGEPSIDGLDDSAVRKRVAARLALVHEADYFALLGVPAGATPYEIRVAYTQLRRRFEPARLVTAATADLTDDLELIVEVLEEAYQILRDPQRRDRYRNAIQATS